MTMIQNHVLKLGNDNIGYTDTFKYLGVEIDSNYFIV